MPDLIAGNLPGNRFRPWKEREQGRHRTAGRADYAAVQPVHGALWP